MTTLDAALAALPSRYAGPGGAVAVLRRGEVIARHCWGWADIARRVPFTPTTMALVCSITKQFTCNLMLDLFPDPTVLDAEIAALMPKLAAPPPVVRLAHNQSGLRDYWATAMLCGAPVEGRFTDADSRRLVGRTASLQFAPGTRYSYCNQNFRLISDAIEARTGQDFATLLRTRVLERAGMPHARLAPDTADIPGGTVGYEGSVEGGFRAAVNNIVWTGDAGLAASIDDMIAWERHIDATRDDPAAIYHRQAAPVTFVDGAPAMYGFGLSRMSLFGRAATGHGGGLRGWRSVRLYIPAERLSVVVLFNHMANPRSAAVDLVAAALGETAPAPASLPPPAWAGTYLEPETGLAVRLEPNAGGLRLHYGTEPEQLGGNADGSFGAGTRVSWDGRAVRLERPLDHLDSRLAPVGGTPSADITGTYHSAEYGADIVVTNQGGGLYGAFQGDLGQGEMLPLLPHAADIWRMPCPRSLDYSAPGDWTLRLKRDGAGRVTGLTAGCWLARGIDYARLD